MNLKITDKQSKAAFELFKKENFQPGHAEMIGDIVRAHIVIEHLLITLIEKANPNMPPLEPLKLNYSKLLQIAGNLRGERRVNSEFLPPLEALGRLRNSLAHNHPKNGFPAKALKPIRDFHLKKINEKSAGCEVELKGPSLIIWFVFYVGAYFNVKSEFVVLLNEAEQLSQAVALIEKKSRSDL